MHLPGAILTGQYRRGLTIDSVQRRSGFGRVKGIAKGLAVVACNATTKEAPMCFKIPGVLKTDEELRILGR